MKPMNELLFYLVILLSNIIQGITGFAGTILAMPFSVRLVGMDTAVPVLNLLGLLSGIYVFAGNYKKVNWRILRHIVIVMGLSLVAGIQIKIILSGNPRLLYLILGTVVLTIAVTGLCKTAIASRTKQSANKHVYSRTVKLLREIALTALLIAAGIVHGMYVCGGPLLISYLTRKLPEKNAFRATISTVWIFLNGMLLFSHILSGYWTPSAIRSGAVSIPFLLGSMFIGGRLYRHMSQEFFIFLTYVLLLIAGLTLFFK